MTREIQFRAWDKESKKMTKSGHVWLYTPPSAFIDKFELMQYTGLKDKHGKEIYEGDVVKFGPLTHSTGIEEVIYSGGGFSPFAIPGWEITPDPGNVEVIGNIYENPELLK